jgi:Outer membrane lipoprotein-sorting protein
MLKKHIIAVLLCIGAFVWNNSPVVSQERRAIELTAQEILARVDVVMKYPKGLLTGSLTHISPDGKSINLMLRGNISDEDFLFIVSSSDRGDQIKILYNLGGEDIWVYNIHSIQLFHKIDVDRFDPILGSNFSYVDISNADFQANYNGRIDGSSVVKGKECYRIACDPIFKKGEYGRIVIFVSKDDYIPLKIDYYDQDKVITKSMSVAQVAQFSGRNFPVRYDMLHVKSGTLSILKFFNVDDKITFGKDIFRHQTLGQ